MAPTASISALAAHPLGSPPLPAPARQLAIVLERVATGLRSARARTGLSEADVASILERQGIALSPSALSRAERTGAITLGVASCLADIYGTTTDDLAGRRLSRKRLSLDEVATGE